MITPVSTPTRVNVAVTPKSDVAVTPKSDVAVTPKSGDDELPAGKRRRTDSPFRTPEDQPVLKPARNSAPMGVVRSLSLAMPQGQPDPAGFPAEPRED